MKVKTDRMTSQAPLGVSTQVIAAVLVFVILWDFCGDGGALQATFACVSQHRGAGRITDSGEAVKM